MQVEFEAYLSQFAERRDGRGRAAVVRNGFQPRRELLTGLGPLGVRVPTNGNCGSNWSVYRSYYSDNVSDANHRFTVDLTAHARMPQRRRDVLEGIVMCAEYGAARHCLSRVRRQR